MSRFEDLLEILQRHLPRAADGGPVTITSERVEVREPGVSVGDLARLLADLAQDEAVLPDDLPLADLTLASLTLTRGVAGTAFAFTLSCTGATLTDIDTAIETCPVFVVLVDHDVFKSVPLDERATKAVYDTRGIWPDQPRPRKADPLLRSVA